MNTEAASATAGLPVPADVPETMRATFLERLREVTGGTGRLMIFAGDQKVEHLNGDSWP